MTSPYINRFLQPDTIIAEPSNPQSWNRYTYVVNNPIRYNDPSGHKPTCEGLSTYQCKMHLQKWREANFSLGEPDWAALKKAGYSDWEVQILQELYNQGGPYAVKGVWYIIKNNVHIDVGEKYTCADNGMEVHCHGDWQSAGDVTGWYDPGTNTIFLNPYKGYDLSNMPEPWGLATIIHEAKHLEQGWPLTKYKELEAMQISIDVAINLGYYGSPGQPPPPGRDAEIRALSLSHDPKTIDEYSQILKHYSFWYWVPYKIFLLKDW